MKALLMHNLIFGFLAMALISPSVLSQNMPFPNEATEGFRSTAKVQISAPPYSYYELNLQPNEHPGFKKELDSLFFWNKSKALIVAKGDNIIYERYANNLSIDITPLGYSMTKSITAITVGYAICEGRIKSIDDKVSLYLPQLKETSWGNSSVRDLLIMSSGSFNSTQISGHVNSTMTEVFWPSIYFGTMNRDFFEVLKSFDRKAFTPGSKFVYNNFDTLVLGLLLESVAGMGLSEYFEKTVWHDVGAQSNGAWLINNLGQTSTFQGFSATPRDWIRLGLFVLRKIEKQDDCISYFMNELSTSQIKTGKSYIRDYGFQTWIPHEQYVDFSFVGYFGQYLLFNKEKNIVLYHHATSAGAMNKRSYKAMTKIIEIEKRGH